MKETRPIIPIALSRALGASAPEGRCPPGDFWVSWVEGDLRRAERSSGGMHLLTCGRCREEVRLVERSMAEVPSPVEGRSGSSTEKAVRNLYRDRYRRAPKNREEGVRFVLFHALQEIGGMLAPARPAEAFAFRGGRWGALPGAPGGGRPRRGPLPAVPGRIEGALLGSTERRGGVPVALVSGRRTLARARTDARGVFRLPPVPPGCYEVVAEGRRLSVRVVDVSDISLGGLK